MVIKPVPVVDAYVAKEASLVIMIPLEVEV
jgi:hypothetical protein